ncbi:MAG: anhydro-N-acetylmuramic acid kinase [Gammaproteobacteria bacterium]|nr:anhydro-N-acetylmuramic acid kinase [Gammaproteobacteria bacterium]
MPEYYVGLMSGTSMDGIDAALVDFSNDKAPELIHQYSHPWPEDVLKELMASRELPDEHLDQLHNLDIRLGEIFADATLSLLKEAKVSTGDIIAIGNHGQTIRHRPDISQPFSLQIGDAKTLAQKTGIRVISDFRTADIEAGGQGAPLAPAFHQAIFHSNDEDRGILNIGGIANLTLLPRAQNKEVIGFDTGPGNNLMDAWIKKTYGKIYDHNGDYARTGKIVKELLSRCLGDDYFQSIPPKSTGFEQFNLDWLSTKIDADKKCSDADIQATLCELTALSIANDVRKYAQGIKRLLVCGGGAHNAYLMDRIQLALPECEVESTQNYGIEPGWVEAMAFAWLARQHIHNLPGNLPSVTGAREEVILGKATSC